MNGGAATKFPADHGFELRRRTPGGADLRFCSLRPLKVGGLGRPIITVGKVPETGEGAMNGIILFVTPTIAALGALASLWLFVQASNAAKTNSSRVRVPARRPRSR